MISSVISSHYTVGHSLADHILLLHSLNLILKSYYLEFLLLKLSFHFNSELMHLGLRLINLGFNLIVLPVFLFDMFFQLIYFALSFRELDSKLFFLRDVLVKHLLILPHQLISVKPYLVLKFQSTEFIVAGFNHQGKFLLIVDNSDARRRLMMTIIIG